MKPFWLWKSDLINKEKLTRDKYWYYYEYGRYCNKVRKMVV